MRCPQGAPPSRPPFASGLGHQLAFGPNGDVHLYIGGMPAITVRQRTQTMHGAIMAEPRMPGIDRV